MKKISIVIIIIVLISVAVLLRPSDDLESVRVIGDIESSFDMLSYYEENTSKFSKRSYKDTRMMAIDASEFLSDLPKLYNENTVYFISADGFMNGISGDSLEGTYLGYSDTYGWAYYSEKHPPNSGIRQITDILIVKDTEEVNHQYGLNIINNHTKITHHFSVGELYLQSYRHFPYLDGVSEKTVDGKTYKVPGMKLKKVIQVKDLIEDEYELSLMMTSEGDYEYIVDEGYVSLEGHTLNYVIPDTFDIYNDLQGIIINPPLMSVLDTYDEVVEHLENRVMILFIDGFSYNQYEYMKESTSAYMNQLKSEKANTVFKPVTNAGFAAMITGQSPRINGVLNRSFRELNTKDIFDAAMEKGLSAVLIEGDINILNTRLAPILNLDGNKNGITDDEIFITAKENLDHDLVMVHFHSLDEYGHDYGDMDKRTLDQLLLLDGYVETLSKMWDGHLIVVTDHGMHTTLDGGDHGEFRYEDMIIPFMWRNKDE